MFPGRTGVYVGRVAALSALLACGQSSSPIKLTLTGATLFDVNSISEELKKIPGCTSVRSCSAEEGHIILQVEYRGTGGALAREMAKSRSGLKNVKSFDDGSVQVSFAGRRTGALAAVRVHVHISGVVQGVSFRASTQEEAKRIGGIVGWVRNLNDGRVEGVFQGPKEKVDRLLEWCRKGPPAASVTGLQTEEDKPANDLKGFEIRPDH